MHRSSGQALDRSGKCLAASPRGLGEIKLRSSIIHGVRLLRRKRRPVWLCLRGWDPSKGCRASPPDRSGASNATQQDCQPPTSLKKGCLTQPVAIGNLFQSAYHFSATPKSLKDKDLLGARIPLSEAHIRRHTTGICGRWAASTPIVCLISCTAL